MPGFTLSRSDRIPDGTDVELYPEADWPLGHPQGAPQGSPTATVTMTDGVAEFTDVDAGFYYAYALVGSEHIYLSVAAGEDTPEKMAVFSRAAGVVVHGDDDAVERPDGYALVLWEGSVEPTNAEDTDLWVNTA